MPMVVYPFGPAITTWIGVLAVGVSVMAFTCFAVDDREIDVGVLFVLGITSVGVYGIALAGWSSNSKYSLMGGLRSSAQMISYELAMGASVLGDRSAGRNARPERHNFRADAVAVNAVVHHPAVHRVCRFLDSSAFAETNRVPFDLPEAETESSPDFTPNIAA